MIIVKVIAWVMYLTSYTYLTFHFGFVAAAAMLGFFWGAHMLSWINDKEKGRLL